MIRKILKLLIILFSMVLASLGLCHRETEHTTHYEPRDYNEIMESGVIRAVTEYNSFSYHVADDTIEGFDYDLLQAYAQSHGLRVEITPEMSYHNRIKGVTSGRYDLLAKSTLVTKHSRDSLLFTSTLFLSKQVLVQRKSLPQHDSTFVSSPMQLHGKTIHLVKDSPALLRVRNMIDEMADTVYIQEVDKYGPEQLISMVAEGDIDYAVCDERTASRGAKEYNNIDISTDISFTQFYAWGMNLQSATLCDSINAWLQLYTATKEYRELCKKYKVGK